MARSLTDLLNNTPEQPVSLASSLSTPSVAQEEQDDTEDITPVVPTKEQAADRAKVEAAKQNIIKSITPPTVDPKTGQVKQKESMVDIVNRSFDNYGKALGKIDEEHKARYDSLAAEVDKALKEKKDERERNEWIQIASGLINSVVQLGAASYGAKHGMDISSGVRVSAPDFKSIMDSRLASVDDKIQSLKEKQSLAANERKEKVGALGDRTQAGMNAELRQQEKDEDRDFRASESKKERLLREKLAREAASSKMDLAQVKQENKQADVTAKPTPGQKKLDEEFAKNYAEMIKGTDASAEGSLKKLQHAIDNLASTESDMVGGSGAIGLVPKSVRDAMGSKSAQIEDDVYNVIQSSLRPILGSQFTAKEGENLLKRTYNPTAPVEVNVQRLQALKSQMMEAAASNRKAAEYFRENGTLTGYNGKTYTINDFNPEQASESKSSDAATSSGEIKRRTKDGKIAIFDKDKNFLRYEK